MIDKADESMKDLVIRSVSALEVHPLRLSVLRANMENKIVSFDGDEDLDTVHLAAFGDDGIMVGTSTWLRRECRQLPGARAVQLRGMATAVDHQGRGVGSVLLEAGFMICQQKSINIVWANARDTALTFYKRHGFIVQGEGFIEAITQLPHHIVIRTLTSD